MCLLASVGSICFALYLAYVVVGLVQHGVEMLSETEVTLLLDMRCDSSFGFARTVPEQCPNSARTVPEQCPNSARTVPNYKITMILDVSMKFCFLIFLF